MPGVKLMRFVVDKVQVFGGDKESAMRSMIRARMRHVWTPGGNSLRTLTRD